MNPKYPTGTRVRLLVDLSRRNPARLGVNLVLPAGTAFAVVAVTQYAGSPEYTLEGGDLRRWANVPESALGPGDGGGAAGTLFG